MYPLGLHLRAIYIHLSVEIIKIEHFETKAIITHWSGPKSLALHLLSILSCS